jgi:hypothetical protein
MFRLNGSAGPAELENDCGSRGEHGHGYRVEERCVAQAVHGGGRAADYGWHGGGKVADMTHDSGHRGPVEGGREVGFESRAIRPLAASRVRHRVRRR